MTLPRPPLVAIVCCVILASAGCTALGTGSAGGGPFTPPPFKVGSSASYGGDVPLNITLASTEDALTRDGSVAPAAVFTYASPGKDPLDLLVRTDSLLVEAGRESCRIRAADLACEPWTTTEWTYQGMPAALGASLLQGRTLRVGDRWTETGDCLACTRPITVGIEAPDASSPLGTDFVAVIDGAAARHGAPLSGYAFPFGRIHMSAGLPYPLLAEMGSQTYRLVATEEGSDPLEAGPRVPVSYVPRLAAAPFADGLPVEGEAMPGQPSLQEARAATGDPAPGAFLSIVLSADNAYMDVLGQRIAGSTTFTWSVRVAQKEADAETRYSREAVLPGTLPVQPMPWSRATVLLDPTATGACIDAAAPLWDLARLGAELPSLSRVSGLALHSPDCERATFYVFGAFHARGDDAAGFGHPEEVGLDPATGLLLHAREWVG